MEKGKSSFACQKLAPSALSYRDGRRRRHCFSPSTHMAVCGEWRKEEGRGGGGWELFNVSPSLIKALPPSSPSHFLCLLGGLGWGKKCVVGGGGREGGKTAFWARERNRLEQAGGGLSYIQIMSFPPPSLPFSSCTRHQVGPKTPGYPPPKKMGHAAASHLLFIPSLPLQCLQSCFAVARLVVQ